jgi:hypothetical protein
VRHPETEWTVTGELTGKMHRRQQCALVIGFVVRAESFIEGCYNDCKETASSISVVIVRLLRPSLRHVLIIVKAQGPSASAVAVTSSSRAL